MSQKLYYQRSLRKDQVTPRLDFTPSEKLIEKMKEIYTLHEAGLTYYQIADLSQFKNHRVTITRLCNWYTSNIVRKGKHEKS